MATDDVELMMLRQRAARLTERIRRLEDLRYLRAEQGFLLAQTQTEISYPATGHLFFSAQRQRLEGTEKEGATPVLTPISPALYPYVLSSGAPASGTVMPTILVPRRWAFARGGTMAATNTTVAGKLEGCVTGLGVPGVVTIKNGGTTLWSGATASNGNYTSASFFLSGTTTLQITGTPTSPRNVAATSSFAIAVGTNTGKNVACPAATGYVCTQACGLALSKTLTLTSTGACAGTTWPSDTLTFTSISGLLVTWTGSAVVTYNPGAGPANYNYQFTVGAGGSLGIGLKPIGGGVGVFVATPLLDGCPESFPDFQCHTNCGSQGIGCTITG